MHVPLDFQRFSYIYTGEAVLDLDNVLGVLYLAKKYKIKELVREVEQFLAGILNRASVNYFLNYVDLIDNIENRYAEHYCIIIIEVQHRVIRLLSSGTQRPTPASP